MPCKSRPVVTRKRKSITQHVNDSKRQRLSVAQFQPRSEVPESNFWDGLSKIWLTEHALRELNRRTGSRNNEVLHQAVRPHTRGYLLGLHNQRESVKPANDVLDLCSPHTKTQSKQSARRGGVDLSDLRGACKIANLKGHFLTAA